MNGQGKMYTGNGIIFEGGFVSNLKHGVAKIWFPDGKVFREVWHNGVLKEHHKEYTVPFDQMENELLEEDKTIEEENPNEMFTKLINQQKDSV